MANIIVPERRKIEVVNGNSGYSRRGFLGLAGRLGVGILAVGMSFGALDGLVGNEENAVYAQGKNGKKTKLKWKVYRNPEKATITYDPETDRTLSKEFIEWDMKGFCYPKKCPILEEESDLPGKILEIGEELKIDPCVIVANFNLFSRYGKNAMYSITKTPWNYPVTESTPEDQRYKNPGGKECLKFSNWGEGIKSCWNLFSRFTNISELSISNSGVDKKPLCLTITQMQLLDEMLDKKTKEGKEYNIKLWKTAWDAVKKKVK